MLSNFPSYRRARLSAAQRSARLALLTNVAANPTPDAPVMPACRFTRQRRVRHASHVNHSNASARRVSEIIR